MNLIHKLIIVLLLLFVMAGCSKRDKVSIGIIDPSMNHLPVDIALKQGLLGDYKVYRFKSGWELNEALVNDKVDIAIMPFTYAVKNVINGKGTKIVSHFERESDGIICHRDIKTKGDLNGKKIGVLRASTLDVLCSIYAKENNLNYEPVYFRTPMDMAAALENGSVNALSYYVPSIFKLEDKYDILDWYGNYYPKHPCCNIVAGNAILKKDPDKVKGFLQLMNKVINERPASEDLWKNTAKSVYGFSTSCDTVFNHIFYITGLKDSDKEFEIKASEEMFNMGYIPRKVNPNDLYEDLGHL